MCTSILVGNKATADGSFLMARSADSSALKAQHFKIHPAREWPEGAMYRTQDFKGATNFEYPYPRHAMAYTTVPNWETQLHGAVGFNEVGVGITGTETIFASDEALAKDPYNTETGITEDDILDVILPRVKSAREGVLLLGEIIETIGAAEGFGVGFVDKNELWYLETGTGHHWLAQQIPADQYFATGNQGRLQTYDPKRDLASARLVEWAQENGFYSPQEGPFNFSKAYTRDDWRDRQYNDPRVWIMQKLLNPSLVQPCAIGRDFAVYMKPEKPVTLEDCKRILRNHYDGYAFDPYSYGLDGGQPWRPISVFRTYESHIVHVRPELPTEIGHVIYLAWGMSDLSCYVPFYHGIQSVPEHYAQGTNEADNDSVYWKWRKLQTLVMTDYTHLAPVVKDEIKQFEAALSIRQAEIEATYLTLVKTDKNAARARLQSDSMAIFQDADALAERLLNRIFTLRTQSIEQQIIFANQKKKD